MSEENKSFVSELISDLKQQRDELRVRLHLGGQEFIIQLFPLGF